MTLEQINVLREWIRAIIRAEKPDADCGDAISEYNHANAVMEAFKEAQSSDAYTLQEE